MNIDAHAGKQIPTTLMSNVDSETQKDSLGGYVLDATQLSSHDLVKLAPDGKTVLIPQPSDDPNDPLNWSQVKKNILLAVVCACTFLPDYGSVTGAVTLISQAKCALHRF